MVPIIIGARKDLVFKNKLDYHTVWFIRMSNITVPSPRKNSDLKSSKAKKFYLFLFIRKSWLETNTMAQKTLSMSLLHDRTKIRDSNLRNCSDRLSLDFRLGHIKFDSTTLKCEQYKSFVWLFAAVWFCYWKWNIVKTIQAIFASGTV